VRLLSADPHHRVLLLERLDTTDLSGASEEEACGVVAGLYRLLHVPALPALRPLSFFVDRWTAGLATMPRGAPIPRRLVEQAVSLGRDLVADRAVPDRLIHTDLHYGNVLAGPGSDGRRRWLAIDPKPVNGDPHYEIAPMLWNRWDEISDNARDGVRRRLWTLVDAAGFDEQRARAWVLVRMVHNAMWAADDCDRSRLTLCVTVAKAVQD
jgi:streptomycin 6-kinase